MASSHGVGEAGTPILSSLGGPGIWAPGQVQIWPEYFCVWAQHPEAETSDSWALMADAFSYTKLATFSYIASFGERA